MATAVLPMHADVVVVGGGMVGAAFAACLAADTKTHGLSIVMLDAEALVTSPGTAPAAAAASVFDVEPRVSALTLATQTLLESIGAWPHISPARACGYTSMEVWDADGTGSISFNAADTGTAALGWIVENRVLTAALRATCAAYDNIVWRAPVRVLSMRRERGRWQLSLTDGSMLTCTLLVGADGALSQVRQQLGFSVHEHDYQHQALVATVETEMPHGNCARQRFLGAGPLAFLPLAAGATASSTSSSKNSSATFSSKSNNSRLCSIVWSTTPTEARRLLALDDAAFARELAPALENRLGAITAVSPRTAFPLIERHAENYVQGGAVLIGDAAHTVHPLAGQGVNLGLLDAATLAEELARNLARGLPFDEPLALRRYERRRKLHNVLMQKSFAGLKQLFEARALPIRWLRNTGMSLLDGMAPLKVLIARQAMGLDGDLPVRCRPALRGHGLLVPETPPAPGTAATRPV